jgi:hypothetical protein
VGTAHRRCPGHRADPARAAANSGRPTAARHAGATNDLAGPAVERAAGARRGPRVHPGGRVRDVGRASRPQGGRPAVGPRSGIAGRAVDRGAGRRRR